MAYTERTDYVNQTQGLDAMALSDRIGGLKIHVALGNDPAWKLNVALAERERRTRARQRRTEADYAQDDPTNNLDALARELGHMSKAQARRNPWYRR